MSEGDGEGFLARWSRRKIEARSAPDDGANAAPAPKPIASEGPPASASGEAPAAEGAAPTLPPLESLTPDSDFAPFMRPGVDPGLKGEALKALFGDPDLYPMDGLDVYIDDYTKPDPLPAGWLEKLNQLATLHGEPPAAKDEELEAAQGSRDASSAATAPVPEAGERPQSDTSNPSAPQPDSKNRGAI